MAQLTQCPLLKSAWGQRRGLGTNDRYPTQLLVRGVWPSCHDRKESTAKCFYAYSPSQFTVRMLAPTSGIIWGRMRSGPRSLGMRAAPILSPYSTPPILNLSTVCDIERNIKGFRRHHSLRRLVACLVRSWSAPRHPLTVQRQRLRRRLEPHQLGSDQLATCLDDGSANRPLQRPSVGENSTN